MWGKAFEGTPKKRKQGWETARNVPGSAHIWVFVSSISEMLVLSTERIACCKENKLLNRFKVWAEFYDEP